jgi:hypothetical protein
MATVVFGEAALAEEDIRLLQPGGWINDSVRGGGDAGVYTIPSLFIVLPDASCGLW